MDETKPPIIESIVQPLPPPVIADYAGYPRLAPVERLRRGMRLVRGFVIGNYWMGTVAGTFIAIGLAGAFNDNRPHTKMSPAELLPGLLFFAFFFVIGFVIGSLSKRQKVSPVLSTLSSITSGVIWMTPVGAVWPIPAFVLLAVYIGLGLYAALRVNRAARRIEDASTNHWAS